MDRQPAVSDGSTVSEPPLQLSFISHDLLWFNAVLRAFFSLPDGTIL